MVWGYYKPTREDRQDALAAWVKPEQNIQPARSSARMVNPCSILERLPGIISQH